MFNRLFTNKINSKIFILPIILLLLSPLVVFTQSKELSLVDIFTALRSKKATLQQKNQLLTEGVKQRGITFSLSKSLQEELQNAGANEELIEAIRQKSPVKIEDTSLKTEPTPEPVVTEPVKDFAFYQNKGNSSFVLGQYNAAIKDYSEAIKLNDKEPSIYISRGLAYYREKQFNSAITDFGKVIELKPDESMVYFSRANALKEVGKFEEALADYKKASELDEDNEDAKNAYEKLQADLQPKPDPNTAATTDTNTTEKPAETNTSESATESKAPLNIGSLQSLIKKLVNPKYPMFEKSAGIEGIVTVRIVLDEDGKVKSAEAIDGPKGLHRNAVTAAKRSKFSSYKVDDVAVPVTGLIRYNFRQRNY